MILTMMILMMDDTIDDDDTNDDCQFSSVPFSEVPKVGGSGPCPPLE